MEDRNSVIGQIVICVAANQFGLKGCLDLGDDRNKVYLASAELLIH